MQRGSGCPSPTGVCSGDGESTPPAPSPLLQQQGWADLAAVPQFPTLRHGPTPHPTLVLAGPERPGEEASWVDGEGVCVRGNNADPSQDQLANAGTAVPFPGVRAVTVPEPHSPLVAEASCSWAPLLEGVLAVTPPTTSQRPSWFLVPISTARRVSARGSAPPYGRVGSVAKHLPSPQSGELYGKTCSPTPLRVISSGTFRLH